MTRRIYWGLGVLVLLLLIGAFSYVIYQEYADIEEIGEDGKAFRDKIAKMDEQRKTQEQPVEVPNTEQVQPMAHDDVPIMDVPIEKSDQHDSFQNYFDSITLSENFSAEDIDVSKFIDLPTDAELVKYSDSQRISLIHSITKLIDDAGEEKNNVSRQRHAVVSKITQLSADLLAKRINSDEHSQAYRKLRKQQLSLQQKSKYLLAVKEALRQQNRRIYP